jgi:hypothetical protein
MSILLNVQNDRIKHMGDVEEKPGEDFGKFKPTTLISIPYFGV